jgi:hypothetical protein
MYKIDMTSPQLDRQIELLKFYPEILEKRFRPALFQSVRGLASRILPTIPEKTGRARETFGSKVTGKGINMTGRVGWYDKTDPWYPNVLEHGAKAHDIKPKDPNGYLRLLNGTYVKEVHHPGFSARGFMAAGYSAYRPVIESLLAAANEGVVKDLALND